MPGRPPELITLPKVETQRAYNRLRNDARRELFKLEKAMATASEALEALHAALAAGEHQLCVDEILPNETRKP